MIIESELVSGKINHHEFAFSYNCLLSLLSKLEFVSQYITIIKLFILCIYLILSSSKSSSFAILSCLFLVKISNA